MEERFSLKLIPSPLEKRDGIDVSARVPHSGGGAMRKARHASPSTPPAAALRINFSRRAEGWHLRTEAPAHVPVHPTERPPAEVP